jgi:hypothetical protein
MTEEVRRVWATEALISLAVEFRALPFRLLTPSLEPRFSSGLEHRGLWVHPNQERIFFRMTGHGIYGYFLPDQNSFEPQSSDHIRQCASLTDLWFFAKFPPYIPSCWRGKLVYGWKTCFCIGHSSLIAVPYLDCSELPKIQPRIRYRYLDDAYGINDVAAVRT